MSCPSCGKSLEADARFCAACGTDVRRPGGGISVGSVHGHVVAIGHGSSAKSVEGIPQSDLVRVFQAIQETIRTRPPTPNVDRAELVSAVQQIEQEASKGEDANPTKVKRWLRLLGDAAPDILLVTLRALATPGVAQSIRDLAQGMEHL